MKTNIKNISYTDLLNYLESIKQPKFRATQIFEWLYKYNIADFQEMTNLPKDLIDKLSRTFVITNIFDYHKAEASDNTVKYVFGFSESKDDNDKTYVESVAIPSSNNKDKLTVCISSQAGCAMGCKFCATGKQGLDRNLHIGEIVDQIKYIQNEYSKKPSNIVVMGQGEPFLNYDNLIEALSIINNQKYIGVGARKITISTCGIIPGINKFTKVNQQYGLAVSLHSAIQHKRDVLMPGVRKYTLKMLKESLVNYIDKTNRRPTLEYLMLNNINDGKEDLDALVDFCNGLHCHINLLKFNQIPDSNFCPSSYHVIITWLKHLNSYGISTTLRDSRGEDVNAACGQLLNSLNS